MILFRLAVETGENIGGKAAIGYDATDSRHPLQVPFTVVLAVHQLQYAAASALYRQVDVAADVRLLGNDVQRLVAHILGVRGGKADAQFGHLAGYGTQ